MAKKRSLLLFFYLKVVIISAIIVVFGLCHYASLRARSEDPLTKPNAVGYPPLLQAVSNIDVNRIHKLLKQGADVNIQASDDYGMSALELAVFNGNETHVAKIVDILLRAGADPGLQDKEGRTPLHQLVNVTVPGAQERIAYLLLSYNAPINIQSDNGNTPMHSIVQVPQLDISLYLFKNFGPMMDLNIRNHSGNSVMDMARLNVVGPGLEEKYGLNYDDPVTQKINLAAFKRKKRVVYEWQRFGRNDSRARDILGRTGLMLAVMRDDYDFARSQILTRDADVNAQANNRYGNRPLNFACRRARYALPYVQLLLANGANPKLTNNNGDTPLHMIFTIKNPAERKKVAKALLQNGAYLLAVNEQGDTPLQTAAKHTDKVMVAFFKNQLAAWAKNKKDMTDQEHALIQKLELIK